MTCNVMVLAMADFSFWRNGSGDWMDVSGLNSPDPGWDENGVPSGTMDAIILVQNITVTFSYSGWTVYAFSMQGGDIGLGSTSAILNMTAGSLTMGTSSSVGNVVQTGGMLEFANALPLPSPPNAPKSLDYSHPDQAGTTSAVYNIDQSAGGTIKIDSGALVISGDNTRLAGTVMDAGRTDAGRANLQIAGVVSLASTAVVDVAVMTIFDTGAALKLESDRTFSHTFIMGGQTHLYLQQHSFTLTGPDTIGGAVHDGTLIVNGAGSADALVVTDDAVVEINTTITAKDGFGTWLDIGTGSARDNNLKAGTLSIDAAGTWDMVGSYGATLSDLGVLDIAGTFKRSIAGESVVSGGTVNSSGTIEAQLAASTITFSGGGGTLGGHITGAGTINFGGNYTLGAGVAIDVAQIAMINTGSRLTLAGDVGYAGAFQGGATSTVDLGSHALTLSGSASLTGTFSNGTVALEGSGTASGLTLADAVLTVAGVITQQDGFFNAFWIGTGTAQDGNLTAGTLDIGAAGTWNIIADYGASLSASGSIDNAGLFEKTAGGQSEFSGGTINSTGTIKSEGAGSLLVFSGNTGTWGGHVTGTGEIDVAGNFTLASGIVLDVATFRAGGTITLSDDLSYAGHYLQGGVAQVLKLGGHDFTVSGGDAFISGAVQGGGSMILTGSGTVSQTTVFDGATLDIRGDYEQTVGLEIGFSDLDASVAIAAGATWNITADGSISLTGGSTFTNDGLLKKTSGTQTLVQSGTFDNSGTIEVDTGTLGFFNGSGTIGGILTGAGAIQFGNAYGLENGLSGDIAGIANLGSCTLTIGKAGGTVTLGSASQATTLQNDGTIDQKADLVLKGEVINGANGTYGLGAGNIEGSASVVTNNGMFEKSGGGASTIEGTFTNNNWVVVDGGSLVFSNLDNVGIVQGAITVKNGEATVKADAAGQLTLTGGTGDNLISIFQTPTHIDGGAGDDTLSISKDMTLNADSVANVEHISISGNIFVDLSKLTTGTDILLTGGSFGPAGVRGTQGADTISSVVVDGAVANNTMIGGGGNDTFIVHGFNELVIEDEKAGKDLVKSEADFTLGDNIENLTLTGADNVTGTGNALANIVKGNGGDNALSGAGGRDKLAGGAGDDVLTGGRGLDTLSGSAGDDTFMFAKGDTGKAQKSADLIKDFSDGDTIDLSAIDAVAGTGKDDAFKFVGTHAFTKHAGQLRYATDHGDTWIAGDTNGDAKVDVMIHLDHALQLGKGDFVL